jgi:hypothetical protein
MLNHMTLEKRPGPGMAMPKENGKWSFHIYPDGAPKEFGEYATEEEATVAAHQVQRIWEANGHTYGRLGAITSQSNVITS